MSNKSMMQYEQEALNKQNNKFINDIYYHKGVFIQDADHLPIDKVVGDCYLLDDTQELVVYDGKKWVVLGEIS